MKPSQTSGRFGFLKPSLGPGPKPGPKPKKVTQTSFERFEFKYWLTPQVLQSVLAYIQRFMRCDDWAPGGQRNTSLYLDSPEQDLLDLHQQSSPDRLKLRVRCYEESPTEPAFFEIKRKVKWVCFKHRATVKQSQVGPLLRGEPVPDLKLASAEEERTLEHFLYAMAVYRAVPTALITCRREAYVSHEPADEVRITFDRDICYQIPREYSLHGDPQAWIPLNTLFTDVPDATTLLEIKARGVAPWWIYELIQEHALLPSAFSKYVTAMNTEEQGPETLLGTEMRLARRHRSGMER